MQTISVKKLSLSALFLAVGIILPFVTMQIPSIGNMMLPMHIPVILCGFLCGGPCGAIVGLLVPLLRSVMFGAPVLLPTALAMSFELGTYGLLTGLLYKRFRTVKGGIYISLLLAMLGGRCVWGVASYLIYHALGNVFTWKIFFAGAFLKAVPGIVIQIVFLPILIARVRENEDSMVR